MRLLLLHLSDLHLRADSDPLLARIESISAALTNIDAELENILVVASGDLAFDGSDAGYTLVSGFFESLTNKLRSVFPQTAVDLISVPGNHDCDFTGSLAIRELVLERLKRSPNDEPSDEFVKACLQVQASYWELAADLHSLKPVATDSKLLQLHELVPKNGPSVQVLTLNTAWMSELSETQGALLFPPGLLDSPRTGDLVIAVLHHPYNWLEAENARRVRGALEGIADIVLTGHEHDSETREYLAPGGQRVTYFEGGALQIPSNPDESAFGALVVDTDARRQKYAEFVWRENRYELGPGTIAGDDGRGLAWREYLLTASGGPRQQVQPSQSFREYLADAGATLEQSGNRLDLADIYVPPDLQDQSGAGGQVPRLVLSETVLDFLTSTGGTDRHLLITGDDQAGKTALAKMAVRRAVENGLVPLLIRGETIPTGDQVFGFLEQLYSRQYARPDVEWYRQLARQHKLIIFDDYHRSRTSSRSRADLLKRLEQHAEKVVLFAHDLSTVVDELGDRSVAIPFGHYRIQSFGHVRRQQLVEKWLTQSGAIGDATALVRRAHELEGIIDTVVGRNFLPPFPIYLLAILQASDAAVPIDISAGTHGYYYELLIRSTLAKTRKAREFDVLVASLSWFAHSLLSRGSWLVEEREASAIFARYETAHAISLDVPRLIQQLIDERILVRLEDGIAFRYPFLRYYFTALSLRDHLHEDAVKATVVELARELHVEENANIFLFLAHLTKDPLLLDLLLDAAQRCYPDQQESSLEEDVAFLGGLGEVSRLVYEDRDVRETRREMAERKDSLTMGEGTPRDESDEKEALRYQAELVRALKTLQILGQVLKNFPGSLQAEAKEQVTRACLGIGRRVLGFLLSLLRANERPLVEDLIDAVRENHPELDKQEVTELAEARLLWIARIAVFGIVRRVANSVGAKELEQVYQKVVGDSPPAALALMDIGIALDTSGAFPVQRVERLAGQLRGKDFALGVLRVLVVHHFYLFPVNYRVKQKICAALNISYVAIKDRARLPSLLKG